MKILYFTNTQNRKIKIRSKEQAREYAIQYQNWVANQNLSYGEIAEWDNYFSKIGKKFGLIKEFKINNII